MKEQVNHPQQVVAEGAQVIKALVKMITHVSLIPCPFVAVVLAFVLGVASLYNGWVRF